MVKLMGCHFIVSTKNLTSSEKTRNFINLHKKER